MAKHFSADLRPVGPGQYVLRLEGELDGSSAAEALILLETLRDATVTLDFTRVDRVELFGARVLGGGLRDLWPAGLTFEVDGLSTEIGHQLCLGEVLSAVAG